ncbi:MAG: SET domain-containing protein [Candidatus Competibacteraceae bacterium]|nr:SET domain-containing protein [Candidatus Competibacteraceae bacterium]
MPPKRQLLNDTFYGLYVQVSTIPNAGKGLFARKFIPAGSLIGKYRGDYLAKDITYEQYASGKREHIKKREWRDYFVHTMHDQLLDGRRMDNHMRWINDPRNEHRYNATMTQGKARRILVRATRDIQPGEEIFMCYGEHYWSKK